MTVYVDTNCYWKIQ